ncbi:MAG: glutamate racemase [Tissierellia bacterium]|nr:glutamate racemase [Tissierellia bacterium]
MNIAIFDSGLGGLSTLKQIEDISNNYYYLADMKRLPYGDKTANEIKNYSTEIVKFLERYNIDYFIVACNTICASAIDHLNENFNYKFISIIDLAIEMAQKCDGDILVLATKRTCKSNVYKNRLSNEKRKVYEVSAQKLVPLIEDGLKDIKQLDDALENYLKIANDKKIKNIILGCTHYPIIKEKIKEHLKYEANIINPSDILREKVESSGKFTKIKIFTTKIRTNTNDMVDMVFKRPMKIQEVSLKNY